MGGPLRHLLWVALLWAAIAGCDDDLPAATEIARMRVLGAKVEVIGDETRATPRPGERFRLTLPTVQPTLGEGVDDVQTLLIRCTAPTQFTGGVPICQEFLDAALGADSADVAAALDSAERFSCAPFGSITVQQMGVSLSCLEGDPSVELRIPQDFGGDSALYLGIVCEAGAPFIDPEEPTLFGCDGDPEAESIMINGQIAVLQDDEDENHNPPGSALSLEFDSDIKGYLRGEWLAPAEDTRLTDRDCERNADDEHLRDIVGGRHEIMIRYDPDAREERDDGELERVEITLHATLGEVERRFTIFDELDEPVDGLFEEPIDWKPPKYFPEELWTETEQRVFEERGERPRFQNGLVRFFITVRDGRGGFDLQTRAVCVK